MLRLRSALSTFAVLFVAAVVVILAGCGGQPHRAAPPPVPRPTIGSYVCPAGKSQMGCANRAYPVRPQLGRVGGAPQGGLFPDVSVYQGSVNWGAIKAWQLGHGWKPAGIFKMGEYTTDPFAYANNAGLARDGMWRAGYWFVRNTGCQHEAGQILATARSMGLKVVVLDTEVPEAAGYVGCLAPPLRAAGLIAVVYTAPGTWPGGANYNLPLWIATYGSGFGCIWTCRPIAWQFTDGSFGSPTYVPSIGFDDVSVDYGITSLGVAPPPPPDPNHRLWYPTTPVKSHFGTLNERLTVERYDGARQHPQQYSHYLKHLEAELAFLASRVYWFAHHPLVHGHPTWDRNTRGWRYQQLIHRAEGKRLL